MPRAEEVVTFRAKKIRATSEAFKVIDLDTGEELWLPKSLIRDPDEPFADIDEEELSIPKWLAIQKGLS